MATERLTGQARKNVWRRRWVRKMVRGGRCTRCGGAVPLETKNACRDCAARQRSYVNKLEFERVEAGLCSRCRAPLDGPHWCCADCRRQRQERRRARARSASRSTPECTCYELVGGAHQPGCYFARRA